MGIERVSALLAVALVIIQAGFPVRSLLMPSEPPIKIALRSMIDENPLDSLALPSSRVDGRPEPPVKGTF
jgi:hypothetical protein